jgi:hypothetical protein
MRGMGWMAGGKGEERRGKEGKERDQPTGEGGANWEKGGGKRTYDNIKGGRELFGILQEEKKEEGEQGSAILFTRESRRKGLGRAVLSTSLPSRIVEDIHPPSSHNTPTEPSRKRAFGKRR